MIAGGPQWARSATRRSHRSWRPVVTRWDHPGIAGLSRVYLSGQPSPSAVLDDALAPIASWTASSHHLSRSTLIALAGPPRRRRRS
jgi:hypothetical protein